ncbi:MAG: ABC transporter permease [Chloroflexi bacterium]|nr:MAG: ABC transporter permease [Chloroflexota bacterium]
MRSKSPHQPSLSLIISAALAETKLRLINISRYPGQMAMEVIIPIIFAAMPMLLGQATAGDNAAANFQANTGTANYFAYLLIGASTFTIVANAFWHIAYWVRFEQETGTLEAVYLTPTSSLTLAAGVALYSAVRGVGSALIAYFLGALIFRFNPLTGNLLLALLFLFVGLIPLYGLTFLFGALVLKVKEANALINLMQWVVSLLMGIFFPVTLFPPWLRFIAQLFPPTWMVNGVRSALLGIGYFLENWYLDWAVLWAFLIFAPLFSIQVFRRVEAGLRRNEGIGTF